MTSIEITLSGCSIPTDTSGNLTVYEDVVVDGGVNRETVADGYSVSYDNKDTVGLADGQTSYTTNDVFDAGSGNAYQVYFDLDNSDVESTATITTDVTLENVGANINAPVSELTISTPEPSLGDIQAPTSTINATTPEPTVQNGAFINAPTSNVNSNTPEPSVSGAGTVTATMDVSEISTTTPEPTVALGTTLIQPEADTIQATTPEPTMEFDTAGAMWRVVRNNDTVETDLFDVEVVDTANPFGNYAIAKIEDSEGTKFDLYPRGTRVDFKVVPEDGTSFVQRFSGFVVERRELNQQGADALEIEAYSFDQFLRRDTVSSDLSGQTISSALESIVKDDTPVTWNASNVTVGDDQTLTQSYRGERVENTIQSIRAKSAFEDFGVNSDLEFFFSPQETTSAPRDIDDTQWFNYDIPEEGKRTINQVTCWYDDGNKSVTVDDGADKQDLQNNLGTDDPVTFGQEITREDITNIGDARAEAEKVLNDRSTTLTGTVTTYGLIDADPGDVIHIEITDRGIDGDFAIAELKYLWGKGQTVLTVVEKRGDQDDLLVGLSDDVKRVEMRNADRNATNNRITNTQVNGLISVGGDVDGSSYTTWRYTNAGRNKIRDGWAGDGNLDITEIRVGNGSSTPTRTDDSLENQLATESASESLPDSVTARYSASFSETDISEVGLFTNGGTLISRALVDDSFNSPVTVTIDLSVSDDSSLERGVLTSAGQTTVRDILADNSPAVPTQYAYGTDGTTPTESDTSLGSQTVSVDIDEILVQEASQVPDWPDVASIGTNDPLDQSNDELSVTQTAFTQEGNDADSLVDTGTHSDSKWSGGSAITLSDENDRAVWTFNPQYTIPGGSFELQVRLETTGSTPTYTWTLEKSNGQTVEIENTTYIFGSEQWTAIDTGASPGAIPPGETKIELRQIDDISTEELRIDVICPHDTRFSYTFDNSTDGDGWLSGPELYPDEFQFQFETANTRRTLQNATCNQTWDDTSNNQYIELSNDGGSNWIRTNNSGSATASFASEETDIDTRVGFSRYGSRSTATPTSGFNGQAISQHRLFADVDAIAPDNVGTVNVEGVFAPGVISGGTTIKEGGQLDDSANLLTHVVFADIDVSSDMRVISSENVAFNNA